MAGRPRQSQPPHVKGTPAGAFGERLAELMATANVTAKDLAEALGKSEDSIWGYMRGTAVPHINDWPKIARKLKLKDARDLLPKLPAK